jgi:hypothetical protein
VVAASNSQTKEVSVKTKLAIGFLLIWVAAIGVGPSPVLAGDMQALRGTWKGEIDTSGAHSGAFREGPQRVLIVQSVEQVEGNWVVKARFGVDEQKHGRVNVNVESTDPIKLRFETGAGNDVQLTVSEDMKAMKGLFFSRTGGGRGSQAQRIISLKKVEP